MPAAPKPAPQAEAVSMGSGAPASAATVMPPMDQSHQYGQY